MTLEQAIAYCQKWWSGGGRKIYSGLCVQCGEVFYIARSSTTHKTIGYCSLGCRNKSQATATMVKCSNPSCKNVTKMHQWRMQYWKRHFCSRGCYHADNVGAKNPKYKGGFVGKDGYRYICVKGKEHILEHRFVMAEHLKRPLNKWEHVHHRDGNRSNNAISNLELWIRPRQPYGQRLTEMLSFYAKNHSKEFSEALKEANPTPNTTTTKLL